MYTVDASVWVYGFDQRESGHENSRHLLEALRTRTLPIIEPMIVLAEVAGAISRTRQDPARAEAFAHTLGQLPNVTILPLDARSVTGRWHWLPSTACVEPTPCMQRDFSVINRRTTCGTQY
jgi:predicted nucleic acid-binding protein